MSYTKVNLQRRQLLSGKKLGGQQPFRPPWAVDEVIFDDTCTNCGDCITACPTKIISFGRGRLPVVDLSDHKCTFCGDCEAICHANALLKQADKRAWQLVASVAETCLSIQRVTCRSCGEQCDFDAIKFRLEVGGKATPEILLDDCTGCGACIAPCPVNAIQITRQE